MSQAEFWNSTFRYISALYKQYAAVERQKIEAQAQLQMLIFAGK